MQFPFISTTLTALNIVGRARDSFTRATYLAASCTIAAITFAPPRAMFFGLSFLELASACSREGASFCESSSGKTSAILSSSLSGKFCNIEKSVRALYTQTENVNSLFTERASCRESLGETSKGAQFKFVCARPIQMRVCQQASEHALDSTRVFECARFQIALQIA